MNLSTACSLWSRLYFNYSHSPSYRRAKGVSTVEFCILLESSCLIIVPEPDPESKRLNLSSSCQLACSNFITDCLGNYKESYKHWGEKKEFTSSRIHWVLHMLLIICACHLGFLSPLPIIFTLFTGFSEHRHLLVPDPLWLTCDGDATINHLSRN